MLTVCIALNKIGPNIEAPKALERGSFATIGIEHQNMWPRHRIQVLLRFLPFARLLAAYNLENFSNNDRRTRNLLRAICFAALLASLLLVFLFNCWSCFAQEHRWSQRAYQLASAFCLMQQFVIYVVMAAENQQISGALQQLQNIVDKR